MTSKKVAVVAYPAIGESERQWIETVRAAHDPQARRIAAHFTLVFPAQEDDAVMVAHALEVCGVGQPFPFAIGRVEAVRDIHGSGAHVFLIPDQGSAELARLHDRLYDGPLRGHLRSDLSFTPHITVGAHADFDRCRALAAELDGPGRRVGGTIDRIDVVEVTAEGVRPLRTLALGVVNGRTDAS